MDTLTGIATGVVHTALITGEYGEGIVHVSRFSLDGGQLVRIRTTRKVDISNGDQVAVAGTSRGHLLEAYAYKNLSTYAKGNAGKWEALIGGLAFLVLSLWWANWPVAVLGTVGGAWCIFRGTRIWLAEHDLRHDLFRLKSRLSNPNHVSRSDA